MPKFHLSNKAVEDLAEIWEYTYSEWYEKQADLYYKFLINTCQELAENPKAGKKYNEIGTTILGYLANKHIVFYQIVTKNELEIIRILHGSMDLKNRIED